MSNGTADFFEIDFLDVESDQSGDAITVRYRMNGITSIHVVDAGFQDTGDSVVKHIRTFYGASSIIDRVVATHPDGDHLGGLRTVLEICQVRELWMLRPWLYAHEIAHRFKNVSSVDYLISALKEAYPNVAALEEIAVRKGISIKEPFQGAAIGAFRVLSPTKKRFLDLVVTSDKTPEATGVTKKSAFMTLAERIAKGVRKVTSVVRAGWGEEVFSPEDISAENKMSVIQFAFICGKRILLTADAGMESFCEAAVYAPLLGLSLPGIDRFQAPHHGSRRNVSTEMLDQWLGPRLIAPTSEGQARFVSIISSAKADPDHPRKSVIRALIHRGGDAFATESRKICTGVNAPDRGWSPIGREKYPEEQEE